MSRYCLTFPPSEMLRFARLFQTRLVKLMSEHGADVVSAVYTKLNSRPRTFTHGDMRTENTFRGKADKTSFRTVDWQTCTNPLPCQHRN